MKLHTDSNNPVAWKALIAANFNQVQIEVVNATEQSIKNSPFGKIPYLETSDGVLSEGNAIARFGMLWTTCACALIKIQLPDKERMHFMENLLSKRYITQFFTSY